MLEPVTESYVDLDTNTATSTTTLSETAASTSDLMEKPVKYQNRAQRRKKTKIRLTKPLKYVRGKYLYGDINVTEAIKSKIPLQNLPKCRSKRLHTKGY